MCVTIAQEEYLGYTIRVILDMDPENPHDWGSLAPMMVRSAGDKPRSEGGENLAKIPELSAEQINANQPRLRDVFGINLMQVLMGILEESGTCTLVEAVNKLIRDHIGNASDSDYLDELEAIYQMAGCVTYPQTIHGYSQGEWVDVLAVATHKYLDTTGLSGVPEKIIDKALADDVTLYESWAFGDVYGYEVIPPYTDDEVEPAPIDSCWGFYGSHEESGLMDAAKAFIDSVTAVTKTA